MVVFLKYLGVRFEGFCFWLSFGVFCCFGNIVYKSSAFKWVE